MCAISGILDLPVDETIIQTLRGSMLRRGPDQQSHVFLPDGALIHTRLSVIDPEGGRQPMHLHYQGIDYFLIYNGELYNTQELREELISLGHSFSDRSDTEVLLHSYAQWGQSCLEKMNGIFAFAVWEQQKRRLFLARDRIGVKPLFYSLHNGGLLFASEIKTILMYPGFQATIDSEGAAELLLIGPGRTPGSGVFSGVNELEPGCCAMYQAGRLRIARYWRLVDREHTETFEQTVERVRFLVEDAIRRQMVSDVPIGAFLSGGLDSSIICSVCAERMRTIGKRLHTFSVDYEHNKDHFRPGKFQPNADSDYIGIMEDYLEALPNRILIGAEELASVLEEATHARDLPGMADVDFSLLILCGKVREKVTVALSGECADEIFGGYPWYRDPEVRERDGFPWAQSTACRASLLLPQHSCAIRATEFVSDRYEDTIRFSDVLPGTNGLERRMKQMVNLNFRWFMQTLLERKDRMSMYNSLEVRVPFCDWRIAEYLYGVPWEMKDYKGNEKGLLRYAFRDALPRNILWRKKSPYPKTYDPQYLQIVRERMRRILEDKSQPIHALVRSDALRELCDNDSAWPWYGQLMQTPQTIAYFLQINHWLHHYHVDICLEK